MTEDLPPKGITRFLVVYKFYSVNLGARWSCVVKAMPRQLNTRKRNQVPILQAAGWVPGSVWTGAENLVFTGIRSRTFHVILFRAA